MTAGRVTLFYDGSCSLCRREMAWLERADRGRGRLRFVDITAAGFDPAEAGASMDALMSRMHARAEDGELVTGMDAIRCGYAAVGRGWMVAPTRWPVLRSVFDRMYGVFARNRVRWFGGGTCADGSCADESCHAAGRGERGG